MKGANSQNRGRHGRGGVRAIRSDTRRGVEPTQKMSFHDATVDGESAVFLLRKRAVVRGRGVTHPKIMITKIAFLPRLLPGVFRLAPVVTTAGYAMPHDRFFFYGISVSALLHVAVFYGFPENSTPIAPSVEPKTPGTVAEVLFAPEDEPELPKPEEKTDEPEKNEPESSETGETRATIGESFREFSANAITVHVDRIAPAVMPNPNSNNWTVPRTPFSGKKAVRNDFVPLKDLDNKPEAVNRIAPIYPPEAKRLGYSGTVLLRFIVDSRGAVSEVEVVRSDFNELNRAAVDAMVRWKFRPGMKNGRRMTTRMEMPMVFSLSNET
ncbi:MAG: TonB family protein [Opitutaceae bacterium]